MGHKTVRMNAFLNAKTSFKKLQFGPAKCFVMNVGKNIEEHKKIELYVDGWKMEEVKACKTGVKTTNETSATHEIFDGEQEITETSHEKYLGQIISSDATNARNISDRAARGTGMSKKIIEMLNHVPGGKFHFEIAMIFRNAYIISTMLSSSEAWYNVSKEDVKKLEKVDEIYLKGVVQCSNQVKTELIYLELGVMPIRYILVLRRIMYLQEILKQKHENTLMYRFFKAQLDNPKRGDWATQTLKDLKEMEIKMDLDSIEQETTEKFKEIAKAAVKNKALNDLNKLKLSTEHRRKNFSQMEHKELKMANYLSENEMQLTVEDRNWIFKCKTCDIDVKANRTWKYTNLKCHICEIGEDETQSHTLTCKTLMELNNRVTYIPNYNDIYRNDLDDIVYLCNILQENMRIREEIIAKERPA